MFSRFRNHKFIFFFLSVIVLNLLFLSSGYAEIAGDAQEGGYLGDALRNEEKADFLNNGEDMTLPSIGNVAFRMFFFLIFVLVLMFLFFLLMQRLLGKQVPQSNLNQDVIRVLCHKKFDLKKGMYLVDVLGKVLVIGSDIEGLNLITEITDPEKIAQAKKMADVTPEIYKLNPFQGILDRFSGDYQGEVTPIQKRDRQTKGLINKIEEIKSRLAK